MEPFLHPYLLLFFLLITFLQPLHSARIISNNQEIKDLFAIAPEFYPDSAVWTQTSSSSDKTFSCDSIPFFGGIFIYSGTGSSVSVTYNTPTSHNIIYYALTFSLNGTWAPTDGFTLQFTGASTETVSWQIGYTYTTDLCSFNDIKIKGKIAHSASTVGFSVQQLTNTAATFGFRKLSFRVATGVLPTATEQLCVSSNAFASRNWPAGSACRCGTGYYWDGTNCNLCDDSCNECLGPGPAFCYTCKFGYYHDGYQCQPCTSTCTDCETCGICSDTDFYLDNVCVPTCPLPFLTLTSGDRRFCLSPCKSTEVLYADGTCNTTCHYPLALAAVHHKQICDSPCPGQTLLYNQGCSSSCDYPLFNTLYSGSINVCEYPCKNYPSEIYYQHNQTCMSTCNFPYVTRIYGAYSACEIPCPSGGFSRYWDGSCQDCPPLLQERYVSDVWVCDPPQCGKVLCSACGTGNTCPDFYNCNTTYGAFCMPYYKYKLEATVIKPILNGVTLSVQVVPVAGVKASEDILNFGILGLQADVDYSVTIEKTSLGVYELEIVILQSVNQSLLTTSFGYAPYTLGLELNYTLPRITFISSGTQSSAQDTGKGSQIAFLIFVITIAGCVFSGGLSSIWTAMPESQYSYYLLYFNVDFLHHTEVYFESLSNYDILVGDEDDEPELDLTLQNVLPRKFFIRDYKPDFITNTDQLFMQGLITISILIVSSLILRYIRLSGRGILFVKGIHFIKKSLKWNLLIRQLLTYSLPVFIAAFVQIYSAIFGYDAYLPSVILSALTLLAFVWFLVYMLSLINHIPKSKHALLTYSKYYGTLWEDLNISISSKYYYWLVAIRGCVLAYAVVFLSVYPYIQIVVMIVFQFLIVSLFFGRFRLKQVFTDSTLNKITLTEELCLLVVKIMIFVFMVMLESMGDKTLILIGWIMILPAAVAQVVQIFYSLSAQLDTAKLKKLYEMVKEMIWGKTKIKKIRRVKKRKILKITRQ